ncbi:MAG: ATP-binding protein [Actinomycetaceae bacterium]|nr:ATP-binding protein [Actinomycetaceae bacterium]MDU0969368.1 ATP-binding protein [Actinomycetaceae bacterium]
MDTTASISVDQPRVIVPIVGQLDHAQQLGDYITQTLPILTVKFFENPEAAAGMDDEFADPATFIPVCILSSSVGNVDDAIDTLAARPGFDETRFILVTTRSTHDDLARSLDGGQILSVMTDPVTDQVLTRQIARRLTRWVTYRHPDEPWSKGIFDQADNLITDGAAEFSRQLKMTSGELATHMLEIIEEVLGPRPRLELPAGVHLTRQGWPVRGVYLILSGSVALHQQSEDGADVLLHHASSGPLIGLNSFTRRSLGAFTAKTTTPVVAVRITMEQLERVMAEKPDLTAVLAMVSLRALSDRLVRAEQLHIEKERLAEQLEIEHEKTARATAEELRAARSELEEAAQFAMLGQMAAGIAHELNNPIAAIVRATDHVGFDTDTLLGSVKAPQGAQQVLATAREGEWLAPRDQRRLTRELAEQLGGDRQLAAQLVSMGVKEPRAAKKIARNKASFTALTAVHNIGSSLRDIGIAARRITGLVQSLRSYSRSGEYLVKDVNIPEGIEDCLRLAAPQLSGVTINRHYDPDLPTIVCYPSRLEQVWTNIVVNAAEAMADTTEHPEITITATRHGDDEIRVRVEDNGPGIPDELLERIFLPRFTTKQGTVHYGLGMGLGICRQIIDAHGGHIKASSSDHGACMSVTLPIAGPQVPDQPDTLPKE